jgi:type IV secretory pathway VirB2 component (pilin)
MRNARDVASAADRGFFGPGSTALAIYGTIAAGMALAIGTDSGLSNWTVIGVVLAELIGFFLAHAYADMLGEHLSAPGTRLWQRLRHAFHHDVLLVVGGLPIVIVFGLEIAAGVDSDLATDIALALLVALLGAFGTFGARRGGASWAASVSEGLLAATLGAGVLGLKLVVH